LIGTPVTSRTEIAAPAAGITIEFREDDTGHVRLLGEPLGHVHRVLAGHRIDHQAAPRPVRPPWRHRPVRHQLLVDLEPPGSVDDHGVTPELGCLLECSLDESARFGGAVGVYRNVDTLTKSLQLVDRGGPLQVGRHEHRTTPFVLQAESQLGGRSRLA
jgi:hypothetical protein